MEEKENKTQLERFKEHIQFEEGMDDSMFSLYLNSADRYVKNATDKNDEHLVFLVAGIFVTYKVPEEDLEKSFNALTPLILQSGLVKSDAEITPK